MDLKEKYNELQRLCQILKSVKSAIASNIEYYQTANASMEVDVIRYCHAIHNLKPEEEALIKIILQDKSS